jgi:glycosyltransferase involved in cell wall biosynthesis
VIPQGVLQSFVRRPFVVTCHGDDVLYLNQAPIRAAKIRALRRSRGIIVISRTLADKIHEWLPGREIQIQSMGCDCSQFSRNVSPATLLAPFDGITVLSVGRLVRSKGTESLIRAVKDHPQFRLIIVGDGPLANELQEIAKPLGDRVVFLGSRDHTELPGIYTASDIFCIPSLSEGLGLVTLEAMASGVCVMGSRVGGIPEIIHHEENGLLFEPENVEALSVTLLRLAEDPLLRCRLAEAAMQTVRKFDYALIGEKYAAVLLDAMKVEKST